MKTYLLSLIFISFGITFFGVNADHTRWQIDAGTINRLVIFGDDYSDMYNVYNATLQTFPSPIDFDGFVGPVCNGPLWWKYMLDAYINKYNDLQYFIPDGQVMNFAYIFAGLNATARPWASQSQTGTPVPDVNQQVQIYLGTLAATGAPPVPNTLHIIFAGINELTHVNPPGSTPPFAAYASELLHAGITILTSPLVGENSQVLYVSLIPQGSSPYITANFPAGTGALLDSAVNVFNGILRQTILAYKYMPNGFPGLEWVDVTAEWARMSAKPAQYGMSLTGGPKNNPVGFCANYVPGTPSSEHCADVNDYYWWNPIWTSAVTHRWLGKRVFLEAFKQGEDEFQTSYY